MLDPKLRTYIIGLFLSCPFTNALENCPLNQKREELSIRDKINYVDQLNMESAIHLIQHHKECAYSR